LQFYPLTSPFRRCFSVVLALGIGFFPFGFLPSPSQKSRTPLPTCPSCFFCLLPVFELGLIFFAKDFPLTIWLTLSKSEVRPLASRFSRSFTGLLFFFLCASPEEELQATASSCLGEAFTERPTAPARNAPVEGKSPSYRPFKIFSLVVSGPCLLCGGAITSGCQFALI